jgi:acyl-CoA synthetase (AMP-forming)/AMP-acid ligase II
MVHGESVMRRYWRLPADEAGAVTADGWLCSGDIGYLDEDGYLYITGRKHHLMVLSTGRKIAPLFIENALTASPFITQAAIFGEGKPYVSAMIVPNLPALAEYFQDDGEAVPSTGHPRVKALLDQVIGDVNNTLDQWEQIREYNLLDQPLTQDTGELTPSMRISRHVVAERYSAQIEAMYPITMHLAEKEITQVQVNPEHLRELLEKENILDAWMADAGIEFLFDLARDRQIDAPSWCISAILPPALPKWRTRRSPSPPPSLWATRCELAGCCPKARCNCSFTTTSGGCAKPWLRWLKWSMGWCWATWWTNTATCAGCIGWR